MNRFEGKVVLVTGGSRNTGLDLVERFVREGAKVWTCGSSAASTAKGAAALAARGVEGVRAMPCDISDPAEVAALFDAIEREDGRLDVLVNNAADQGLGQGGPLEVEPDAMLWRPWRSGAWILPDGTALGLLSPRQTGVKIRFWKDSALHSDAEMRYPYRTLAPGETWAPEHRPFVIGGTASGGESGWREFCNEVKRIENTAR